MTTPTEAISGWLDAFGAALKRGAHNKAADMFDEDSYWRDLVSMTWNIKTAEGRPAIKDMLAATAPASKPSSFAILGEGSEGGGITEGWFTFETATGRGKGHLRLKGDKAWTMLTTLVELKGHEEKKGPTRDKGVAHGTVADRTTWLEARQEEMESFGKTAQPYCLIVGGGQGGIMLAARLKRLGVPTLVIEKNEKPGDSWRKRYKSLCLHDPVWYDHFPYLPFPDHWPVFSPKDKIGDWIESYAKIMELDFWGSAECKSATYDEKKKQWVVKVRRGTKTITLTPKQLVLATGMSGVANVPKFKGARTFKGQQMHSSQFTSGEAFRGKTCVVIGSNNSAHDICADLVEHGADVTMVQRSSTHIARSDSLMDLALGALYSEQAMKNGITTDTADLIFASLPYKILHVLQIPVYEEMARRDADFYDKLKKRGFLLDFGDDGSGLFLKYLRRGSGYYIDVGASQLVIDGKIKLKTGVAIKEIKPKSVVFSDGSELKADLIVYATGYGSMNGWAEKLISKEVADKVGKCWGLGSDTRKDPGPWEGELRNMWKPTQQEALWFHGGNLHQSRHYSQFLSLQLKARMEGIPTPVYGMQQVNHLS
jgi:putative flavoprotein involved in K+ transport